MRSRALERRIGLDGKTLEKSRFGALTHDLGKIGIADDVLNKPAGLGSDEFDIMKQPPDFSSQTRFAASKSSSSSGMVHQYHGDRCVLASSTVGPGSRWRLRL